ncbi:MAG: succinylglutamate desuccinylase/aspartoacylase family protein, partial [Rhizobacter sp.]|nr:succinylglutamate desuccinylase/aspartoacylase family protein [Rhizobacter sp.]
MKVPIELQPPDISRWRPGNTGTEFVWSFDSGRRGPHVMVQALTHGNEICGAIALDWLLQQPVELQPVRGRLTLAFANVEAFARWDPQDPDRSRYVDEDMNRVWADEALLGMRDSIELRRARALRPFVDSADFLLDIHSMSEPCVPIMVCGATGQGGDKGAAYARKLKVPEVLLIDTGHPAGLRMIERGHFGNPRDVRTALLVECGQHWEQSAAKVALDTVLRFLQFSGAAAPEFVAPQLAQIGLAPARAQRKVRVTEAVVARSLDFRFERDYTGLEVIAKAGDPIAHDGDEVIRAPY